MAGRQIIALVTNSFGNAGFRSPFNIRDQGTSSTESFVCGVWATAGTISNLRVRCVNAVPAASSQTVALRINGADSALTVTLAAGDTVQADTTHSVSIAAGDTVNWHTTKTGSGANSQITLTYEFVPSSAGQSVYGGGDVQTLLPTAVAKYNGVWRGASFETLASSVQTVGAVAGTITGDRIQLDGTPGGTATYVFAIYKNGVKQDGSGGTTDTRVTVTSAATTATGSFSLAVAAGDIFYLECTPVGTPTARRCHYCIAFTATTDGESNFAGFAGGNLDGTAVRYVQSSDTGQIPPTATEGTVETYGAVSGFTLDHLYAAVVTAPGASKSYAWIGRLNAANAGPTCTIAGAATTAANDTSTPGFAIIATDEVCVQVTPAGSPAQSRSCWAYRLRVTADIPPPPSSTFPALTVAWW